MKDRQETNINETKQNGLRLRSEIENVSILNNLTTGTLTCMTGKQVP